MSHVVQIRTQVRDPAAVRAGCKRLGIDEPVVEKVKLFSETVSGLAVRLRDWRYPVGPPSGENARSAGSSLE